MSIERGAASGAEAMARQLEAAADRRVLARVENAASRGIRITLNVADVRTTWVVSSRCEQPLLDRET